MILFQGFIADERTSQIGSKSEQEVSDCPRKRVEQVWMSAHVYRPQGTCCVALGSCSAQNMLQEPRVDHC
jgi:hypothetical protein